MAGDKDKADKSEQNNKQKNKIKKQSKLASVFKDMASEYKKIVWLSFKDLCKQTINVIFVCFFFGIIIFAMDAGFGYCMTYVTDILSK